MQETNFKILDWFQKNFLRFFPLPAMLFVMPLFWSLLGFVLLLLLPVIPILAFVYAVIKVIEVLGVRN